MLLKPLGRMSRYRLERARFLKQMPSTRNDDQMHPRLQMVLYLSGCLAVERQHVMIQSANQQQGRTRHCSQSILTREIGPSTTRHHRLHQRPEACRRTQRRRSARAGPEVAHRQMPG